MSSLSVSEQLAIRVEDVSVTYLTSNLDRPTLRTVLSRVRQGRARVREIKAVKGVTLEVPRGHVLGIVGVNGAGKSTLVRTIAGILPPTSGRVEVNGRVSTLLSLGVGFNKKLTGHDNVVLGGLAAGLTRDEVATLYEEIVAFSELEEFMDMPMRTYSSGMYGRLAFAVAVHMHPDILLIDEALATGDARFRRKSFRRMRELCQHEHTTVVLVSHALGQIRKLCDEVVWMHKGELQLAGEPEEVLDRYTDFLEVGQDELSMEDV